MNKILHINLSSAFGGGERQTANLISFLSRQPGIEQVLITRPGNPLAELGEQYGCRVVEAKNQLQRHFSSVSRGVDLVHCHDGRAVYWGLLHRWLTGTPYLISRRVEHPISAKRSSRWAYQNAEKIICLSRAIRSQVAKVAAIDKTVIIPSACFPVPSDPEKSAAIRARYPGKRLIGQIGALIDLKGQRYTLEVAKQLRHSHPEVHFLFLGSGPNLEELKHLSAGLSNVEFVGQIQNVGDYLACFELLLMPSLMEGFGSTILEAMHHGVAVIASEVGGIPDIIQNQSNGLLVPPADSQALEDAVVRLLEQPTEREQIAERGRQTVEAYHPDVVFNQCWALYRDLLGL
ncbi:glycosyltransferase family 1 protein [Motiliproteus coralliicola]|uniref:Glycosyltransferase family 1 protein n=1 Tax=Motiliproteus coralliicola TaxID=2283196 RepID=A0A369WBR9_9GAMM|nr:glycosyltransferase family 4 protein [Motiliproteus coralliicola]RDE18751.1 glycosyltransferase family 1 protein [Motiliproteus coralliicola]